MRAKMEQDIDDHNHDDPNHDSSGQCHTALASSSKCCSNQLQRTNCARKSLPSLRQDDFCAHGHLVDTIFLVGVRHDHSMILCSHVTLGNS